MPHCSHDGSLRHDNTILTLLFVRFCQHADVKLSWCSSSSVRLTAHTMEFCSMGRSSGQKRCGR